jgi:hypothetical protein
MEKRKRFRTYDIGSPTSTAHADGKLITFLTIDLPYKIHTVLTDNGMAFAICQRTVRGQLGASSGHISALPQCRPNWQRLSDC